MNEWIVPGITILVNTATVVWWASRLSTRVSILEKRADVADTSFTNVLKYVSDIRADLAEIKGALSILVKREH